MKTRTLKQIEKEYQTESNKLIAMTVDPRINIEEFNKQKAIVDELWKEYLKLASKITRMKGGR